MDDVRVRAYLKENLSELQDPELVNKLLSHVATVETRLVGSHVSGICSCCGRSIFLLLLPDYLKSHWAEENQLGRVICSGTK